MQSRFHLIVSTLGRVDCLKRLLDSLQAQEETFFLTVVEQSDERICQSLMDPLVAQGAAEYISQSSARGLSRGRNRGLEVIRGEIVAFPDDDCWFLPGTLKAVSDCFNEHQSDGVSVRLSAPDGEAAMLRWRQSSCWITPQIVPRTVTSATLFLSAKLIATVGKFDTTLGVGSGTIFGAGEETDYVIRALKSKAKLYYDPFIEVMHEHWHSSELEESERRARVKSYNRGFGRVLRKHNRLGDFVYWSGRSVLGIVLFTILARKEDRQHQIDQLRGRVEGWTANFPDNHA